MGSLSGSLSGRVAVVTGASKGIGAGIAKALAEAGAAVAVNYASSREGAERVVAEITKAGGNAIAVQGDVSRAADVTRFFAEARKALGPASILINNAGVFRFDALDAITEAEFHRQFNTNVLGLLLATQEAVRHFPNGKGSIINISSAITSLTPPNSAVYTATKGAVDAITRVLAKELGPKGIRVNAVGPGPVETEGFNDMGGPNSDMAKHMVSQTPLGRIGQPRDIAQVAVFLASDEAGWLTGEVIAASGGYR